MRLMLVLALVLSASACARKPAPKAPAAVESQKTMEPAGEATESDADNSKEGTMKGDPCDGGEAR